MKEPAEDARLKEVCRVALETVDARIRMVWDPKLSTRRRYTWNGRDRVIWTAEREAVEAAHDVAHVLVCAHRDRARLRLPEWGLGPDPARHTQAALTGLLAPQVLSDRQVRAEEDEACVLHWVLAAVSGGGRMADQVMAYLGIDGLAHEEVRTVCARYATALPEDAADIVVKVLEEGEQPS